MEFSTKIRFADEKLKKSFEELKYSKTEDKNLYEWISKALKELEINSFCGIQIPKRLIPKEYYKKFGNLDNLWKYNLPNGWRLIYFVVNNEVCIVSVVIEWLKHKDYERRFGY